MGDAGTRLLFKLRSRTHGLNEELGRHRGREGKYCICVICVVRTVKVWVTFYGIAPFIQSHALFLEHLKTNLGNEFDHFKSCDIAGKSHFILGTKLW